MLLLVVSSIAITNLVVGYFLGVHGVFEDLATTVGGLLKRERRTPDLELPAGESLTAPAPTTPTEAGADQAIASAAEQPPKTKLKHASKAELMEGLAAFRDKLNAASVELKVNRDDEQEFDKSASKLQDANHEYLGQINGAIERLGELGSEGDAGANAAKSAVEDTAKQAERVSEEIDSLMDGGLDAESRAAMVEKSVEMCEAAAATSEAVQQADDQAQQPADESTEEVGTEAMEENQKEEEPAAAGVERAESLDALFDKLDAALAEFGDGGQVLLAEVRPDRPEGVEDVDTVEEVVLNELLTTTEGVLGETQAFVSGDRCVMLLKGDAFEAGAQRVEQIRQQMAAISYERGDEQLQVTVTCGIIEADAKESRSDLEERLQQAVSESERLGANRTFHHDGAFPTPIPEMPAEVTKRAVTLTAAAAG